MSLHLPVDREQIEAFCRKWKIKEFSFFGSVLTDDFRPDSDVDVLVVYEEQRDPGEPFGSLHAAEELAAILGREVDLVEKSLLRNPFRRHHILTHREIFYAA